MKKLIAFITIAVASGVIGWVLNDVYQQQGRIIITDQVTDERGLTSVSFIQDGKEYALDYLTKTEYLTLINRKP